MEYRKKAPVTKSRRTARRNKQRVDKQRDEEHQRQRGAREGKPDELGIFEGQNGELGNTIQPQNSSPTGRSAH